MINYSKPSKYISRYENTIHFYRIKFFCMVFLRFLLITTCWKRQCFDAGDVGTAVDSTAAAAVFIYQARLPAHLTHLTYINEINDDWLPFYRFRHGGTQTYIIVHRTFYFCERLVRKKWLASAAVLKLKPLFLRADISLLVIQLQWNSWNIQYTAFWLCAFCVFWQRMGRKKQTWIL